MTDDEGSAGTHPAVRLVAATVHGRYLVLPSDRVAPRRWLIGFHGYAQGADEFLDMLGRIPRSDEWLVVSVQALHPFYNRANQVVANWMTRQDREHAIADNIAYVDTVIEDMEREFGTPETVVFAGFSQGVAMAYRAGVRCRRRGDAIFAVAGDVPPELSAVGGEWPIVRIMVGTRETFYTAELQRRDLDLLEAQRADARVTVFEGGHEWTDEVVRAGGELLAELSRPRTGSTPR